MDGTDSQKVIGKFSPHLFWDVERRELDWVRHRRFIVQRVLEHGFIEDWRLLREVCSLETVVSTAQELRSLDSKALAFVSCLGQVPEDSFRCSSFKQSLPKHWKS